MFKEIIYRLKKIFGEKTLPTVKLIEVKPKTKEAKLLLKYYKSHKRGMIANPPKNDADIRKELEKNFFHFLVKNAKTFKRKDGTKIPAGVIVGACGLQERQDSKGKYLFFRRSFTDKKYRRAGFGEASIVECEEIVKKLGYNRFRVRVHYGNIPAENMMYSAGFTRVGSRLFFPESKEEIKPIIKETIDSILHLRPPINHVFEKKFYNVD